MPKYCVYFLTALLCLHVNPVRALSDSTLQHTLDRISGFNASFCKAIDKQYDHLSRRLVSSSEKTLKHMQRQEARLQKQLQKKDSVLAKQLSASSSQAEYQSLQNRLQSDVNLAKKINLKAYVPQVDSMQTMLNFLGKYQGQSASLIQAVSSVATLQQRLQQAADIQQFLQQRKAELKQLLQQSPIGQSLQSIDKEVYYYKAQVSEYKEALQNPDKLAEKALQLLRQEPVFNSFMQQNSILSQLFPAPGNSGTPQGLAGLQTRANVQQQLSSTLNMSGVGGNMNPQSYLQQQTHAAQTQLNVLKDKINQAGEGHNDLDMPQGFTPNHQKTKTFWKRLEYGFNIQTQRTNNWLPATSDLALTVGYKLSDKSTIGIGTSYKLGWGKPINEIKMSTQGMALRSFLDIKLKGSIWMTGGYELNYQSAYADSVLHAAFGTAWYKSGLIGLGKKYRIGKKTCNMQLLWDFLSYSQIPKTQALKFRIGYTF